MRHGRFATGNVSRDLTSFKVNCRKTKSGPDPYNVNSSNLWDQRKGSPRFSDGNAESRVWTRPRPDCARSLNLDPYSLSSRDNPWKSFGRVASARAPASTSRSSTPRSSRATAGYFSPFSESLSTGSRAHTPRTPMSAASTRMGSPTGRRNTWSGGYTEPTPFASKNWDWGGVSPGGLSSPATLPPLPAACRF